MLLILPIILSVNSLNLPIIPKIIPNMNFFLNLNLWKFTLIKLSIVNTKHNTLNMQEKTDISMLS